MSSNTIGPVHFAYFAVGLICVGMGIAGGTRLIAVEGWSPIQLVGFGLVAMIGGLWSILGERLRVEKCLSARSVWIQLAVGATNLFMAMEVASNLGSHVKDAQAVAAIVIYLLGALVGFLAVHINGARSREQVACAARRWCVLTARVFLVLGFQMIAVAGLVETLGTAAERAFVPWFVLTMTAAVFTGIVTTLTGSSVAFHRERRRGVIIVAVGGWVAGVAWFALAQGELQLLLASGLLGLLFFDLTRPVRGMRAFNALVGSALVGATLVGTYAAIGCGADGAMWAPVGIATAAALVVSVLDHVDDRGSSHFGWMVVCAGMFVAAMLPYEVADRIAEMF